MHEGDPAPGVPPGWNHSGVKDLRHHAGAGGGTVVHMAVLLAQDQAATVELVTNQLLLLATIVGAIAALPALIQFVVDLRKRRERIALSLEDEATPARPIELAGLEETIADISDLIDRAAYPAAYRDLSLGNELLILGPALSGKKSLARRIAQLAGLRRIITVYNPRNTDALAKAKSLLRDADSERVMLLLPAIDQLFDDDEDDEDVEAELDALIETVSQRDNVLVVGTATKLAEGDDLDNLFGMKIVLPGAAAIVKRPHEPTSELQAMLDKVARHYVQEAHAKGCPLDGLTLDEACAMILTRAANPAEVQDIVQAARTTAIHRVRTRHTTSMVITREVLEKAIRRVMGQ